MKVKEFPISTEHGQADFHKFTATYCVDHVATTATTVNTRWATVYYQDENTEQVRLAAHMTIAQQIASDYEFCNLRDQRSKELWLLAEWGIVSADAKDIICLASDGMARVREKAQVSQ